MRDLSNHTAPYLLFDGALAVRERAPKTLYEKLMARVAKTTYAEPNPSFFRTLHSLSYRGEYNIGILFDRDYVYAKDVWDALVDEEGHPIYRVLDGVPQDVDFIAYPIKHFFSTPGRASLSRVGADYNNVWGVLG